MSCLEYAVRGLKVRGALGEGVGVRGLQHVFKH
jgi:hypothetical protein